MNIAIASDHVGLELKRALAEHMREQGHTVTDFGTDSPQRCDYPYYGFLAASAVAEGSCDRAVLCCGTGIGISLAANKVRGIRCAVCSEPYSAKLSRKHNDTNALSLGSRVVGKDLALMILDSWLNTDFEGGRHFTRVDMIRKIEEQVILSGISSRGYLLMNPFCYGIWRIHHFTQEAQCVHKGASGINKPHHLGFFLSGVCKLRIKLPKSIFLRVPIQTNCPECEYDALIISRDSQYCFMIHIVNLQLNHAFQSPLIYRFGFSYNLRPHPSK